MSLDKVTNNQERPDAQNQISISLADMEQFMQSRQQTARPLHYMSEHEGSSFTNSVSNYLKLAEKQLLP